MNPKLIAKGTTLGRDALFDYLRESAYSLSETELHLNNEEQALGEKISQLAKRSRPFKNEEVLVSDIIYVQSNEGDVVKALDMTIKTRCYRHATIYCSDRRLQYCSSLYQDKLKKHGIALSMTDGYDCYQNALAERVNGILKQELLITLCKGLNELKTLVEESIYTYNEIRPHLSIGMNTPNKVHEKSQ